MVTGDSQDVTGLVRSDVWFADGNVVLTAGRTAFKVHRGQLERHSEVFRDLFSMPQPLDQTRIDGCSSVELYDTSSDVLFLLKALYDGLYFSDPAAVDFPVVAGVLRLSTKYMIDHLRQRCILRLQTEWPTSLLGWDVRERQATDALGRYKPRNCFAHPVLVIQLARELGLDALLPAALYDLSRYAPRKILSGCEVSENPLPPPGNASTPHSSGITVLRLSREDVYLTLLGREHGQRYLANFIERELSLRNISAGCLSKHEESGRTCRESFYFIMLNVLRSVGGIACGRDADPLYTLMQAIDMLSRTDFSDGVKQCGLRLCSSCKAEFSEATIKAREDVWTQVPSWFGLHVHPAII